MKILIFILLSTLIAELINPNNINAVKRNRDNKPSIDVNAISFNEIDRNNLSGLSRTELIKLLQRFDTSVSEKELNKLNKIKIKNKIYKAINTAKSELVNQEIQELLGFSINDYEPCVLEVIKHFWPQIKQSKLIDASCPKESLYRIHRLLTPSGLQTLFTLATQTKEFIRITLPEGPCSIFSLGQSPAWLIEMMKVIDKKQKINDTKYDLIAFSGSWYDYDVQGLRMDRTRTPSPKKIEIYKNYLNKLHFTDLPEEKTFIIEFPHSASGLVSFMDTTKQCLSPSFDINKCRVLISKPYSPCPGTKLSFIDQETILKFIVPMANSDKFDDRLVMSYHAHSWHTKDPLLFQASPSAKLLQEIIGTYVDLKVSDKSE